MSSNGFQPGDILNACDNELYVPYGYLGHSAIVVSPDYLVEAILDYPYIQISPIAAFLEAHKCIEIYRPRSPEWGERAAAFARWYLDLSNRYKQAGQIIPPFTFSPQIPLQDPWAGIYCSKLVWLCYHYGAGVTFGNDFALFTPQDLDAVLERDQNFQCLYKHPQFQFFLDT